MRERVRARRWCIAGVLLFAAMAVDARVARAQQVSGTVRDSASQLPLPGSVVLVLDPAGRPAARGTTDQAGRFRLTPWGARPAGRAGARPTVPLHLRVLRMGFRPREVPLGNVAASTSLEIGLTSFPITLEEFHVEAATCPRRPDRAAALGLLRQVRMALLANVVARSRSSATMTRLLFERRFDGESGRIAGQSVQTRITTGTTSSFTPEGSAATFDRRGFLRDSSGSHTYLGPDAETLVDDAFAERYCFKVAPPDRARPRQVGLGFEPVEREDGRIDIVGTLWVDTLTRVLQDLSFRYVGLDRQTSALAPEGRLSFRELANGVVIIDQWSLRLAGERGGSQSASSEGSGNGATRPRAQEIGGEIARASWPDGFHWTAPLGALRLHAEGSDGRPATGSVVHIQDTDYHATMEGSGTFVVNDLLPGPYTASIRDPRLAELDIPSTTPLRFTAIRDSTIYMRVVVETAESFMAKRCDSDPRGAGRAWLLGRVVAPDGRPLPEARWTMRDEFGAVLVEGGRVDRDGLFQWCQLPLNRSVTIEVSLGDRRTSASRVINDQLTTLRFILP